MGDVGIHDNGMGGVEVKRDRSIKSRSIDHGCSNIEENLCPLSNPTPKDVGGTIFLLQHSDA
jgi:hypothetical protein